MDGRMYEGFTACMKCQGEDEYVLDTKNPELCKCDPEIKDLGIINDVVKCVVDQGPVNFSWEPTSVGMNAKDMDDSNDVNTGGGDQGPVQT